MAKVKGELLTAGLQSIWSSILGKDTVTVAARPQGQLVPLCRACLIRSIGKGDVKAFWSLFDMAEVKGELLTAGLQSIWSSIRKKTL